MPTSNTRLTFLLAERRRFSGQKIDSELAKALARADKLSGFNHGEQAQLERHVAILPRRWPMAALTRQYDAKDAANYCWLRADPAHVRAEMGVVRLLGCGDLGLTQEEADELVKPLKIIFGDVGFPLSAPNPSRWYLMLPKDSKIPTFQTPHVAMGADIFAQFPADDSAKRWRALLNEAQITLHNHPLNAERAKKGLLPVNSLYFWGGGILPDQVKFHADQVISKDVSLQSLISQAAMPLVETAGTVLNDCRHIRDWSMFEREFLLPALVQLRNSKCSSLVLDFADGAGFELKATQKWRFWRGSLDSLV